MRLIWVSMTNFGSVHGEQRFYLPVAPGLYHLTGPNGAGKSTVWKAITWCLYGKTPEGLKGGEVCTWGIGKGTSVQLMLDRPAGSWLMTRSWKPNRWELADEDGCISDLTKDETNPVLDMVRMSFAAFTQCIILPQRRELFLDMRPDAKAALFSEVLDLDQWTARSSRASDAASALDRQVRDMERDMAELQGKLSQAQTVNYDKESEQWEAKRTRGLDTLGEDHSRLCEQSRKLRNKIQDEQKRYQTMEAESISKWVPLIRELDQKLMKVLADKKQASKHVDKWGLLLELNEQRAKMDECSKCGQKMDAKHKALCLDEAEVLREELKRFREVLQDAEDLATRLVQQKDELDAQVGQANDQLRDLNYGIKRMQTELAGLEQTLDAVEERAEDLERAENPWVLRAREAEAGVQVLQRQINATTGRLDALVGRFNIASYWVRWFKDIRLQLVGEELAQLEVEANSSLAELGLPDWELRFDVDRETAKGTIQRGFAVTVLSPANSQPVPWEAWSGGEAQRLLIATQMGMANLGRANTGSTIDLEVWDEPTTHLEPQGVQDLLECLARRAQQQRRQIWIVDHTVIGFAGFAGTWRASKTEQGTVYESDEASYR